MFVFHLETHNDEGFAEAFLVAFYNINRLRGRWDRDLASEEIQTEGKYVVVFTKSRGSPGMNMLKCIQKNYECGKRTYMDKEGNAIVQLLAPIRLYQ